jgi:recombination protein RecA
LHSASAIRLQIEAALARKIPSALTPAQKMIRPTATTGVEAVDAVLHGGLPIGAVSELVGPECSGRTSLTLSFVAKITQAAKVCAWVDVSNTFDPLSAAALGVDLARLLWIRCGVAATSVTPPTSRSFSLPDKYLLPAQTKKGLHGGGFGPHPRGEAKGLSRAVSGLLRPETIAPRCAEPQRRVRERQSTFEPSYQQSPMRGLQSMRTAKPWSRMEQAMRATDLLLQAGGFSAIVLDMGSVAPEAVSRVPIATWFRYRAAAERTQSSIVLLTQYPCAKSSAELLLRLGPGVAVSDEATVFSGLMLNATVERRRFAQTPENVVSIRKPPAKVNSAMWRSRAVSAGPR